jgi:hypothetical protein
MGFGRTRHRGAIIIVVHLHESLTEPLQRLVCTPGWRDGDGGMKVLWLWHDPEEWIPVSRLREALARLC